MNPSRLTALCFLMLAAIMLAACSAKPESTVEAFYKAIAAGNVDKATEQVSFADVDASDMTAAKGKLQMMAGEMKNRIDANGGLDKVEIVESGVDGDTATVQIKLIYGNGKELVESHRLVRADGKWRIDLF